MGIYLRAWIGAFCPRQRQTAPLTPRRLLFLALFPLFIAMQIFHWMFLALDHLIFPAFLQQQITRPVFVLGVPRSGTTYLHRALSADTSFTTTRTWELVLAPSLCQRYLLRCLLAVDRRCGAPLLRALRWLEQSCGGGLDAIHEITLNAAEEDYLALLPAAGCFFVALAFPGSPALRALGEFDALPAERRRRLMNHYHGLLQRHVFAHGGRQLLSKNAAFASWGLALKARYPDAIMLLCIREPLMAVSSQVSALQPARALFATDAKGDELPRMFRGYYKAWFVVLEALARNPDSLVIDQEWMANHSDSVLARIYMRLGRKMPVTPPSRLAASTSGHCHDPAKYQLERKSLDAALWQAYDALKARAVAGR